MARGNLLLGKAKGKLGSVVFAQANGEQITRSKPESVKNPKSTGQNTQRAILATIAKAAAAMTSLVDHSFANVQYGAESVRHFRKINLNILRNLYLNTQNGANLVAKGGNFVPNPLKISEGNLPSFFAIVNHDDVAFRMNTTSALPASGDITVADFLNVYPALQGGDQITLVKIEKINEGQLINDDAIFTMHLDRIVFAPNAFDDTEAVIITEAAGTIERNFLDLTKTTNPSCISVNTEGGLGFTSDGEVYYTALILSRKVNGKWQRSTQYLEQVEFDDHTNNESAIASYGATESVSAETEYLNQAQKAAGKTGVKGAYALFTNHINEEVVDSLYVDPGQSNSSNTEGDVDNMIVLDIAAFGDGTKHPVKCEIQKGSGDVLATGVDSCCYSFKLASASAIEYVGIVTWSDGTTSDVAWPVSIQA